MADFTKGDRELLIRVDERTRKLDIAMTNHLNHHFRWSIMAWSITLTSLIGIIVAILVK